MRLWNCWKARRSMIRSTRSRNVSMACRRTASISSPSTRASMPSMFVDCACPALRLSHKFRFHQPINDKYAIATMKNKTCIVVCDAQCQGSIGENTATTAAKVALSKLTRMSSVLNLSFLFNSRKFSTEQCTTDWRSNCEVLGRGA